jgi:hypothetical protein
MEADDAVNLDLNVASQESDSEDEDFVQFAVLIAFPRRARIFRDRPNHLAQWSDDEFLQRF